jgi:hypothetical protein
MNVITERGIITPAGLILESCQNKLIKEDCVEAIDILLTILPDITMQEVAGIKIVDNRDKGGIAVLLLTKKMEFVRVEIMRFNKNDGGIT